MTWREAFKNLFHRPPLAAAPEQRKELAHNVVSRVQAKKAHENLVASICAEAAMAQFADGISGQKSNGRSL